jgi:multiple sugar transport system permease protein
VSVAAASTGLALARRRHRRRRVLIEAGSVMLAVILLIWSLIPVYNMFLIALDPEEGEVEFTGNIWPPEPSLDAFGVVLTQADRYLEHFWQQFGNSLFIGLMTM